MSLRLNYKNVPTHKLPARLRERINQGYTLLTIYDDYLLLSRNTDNKLPPQSDEILRNLFIVSNNDMIPAKDYEKVVNRCEGINISELNNVRYIFDCGGDDMFMFNWSISNCVGLTYHLMTLDQFNSLYLSKSNDQLTLHI